MVNIKGIPTKGNDFYNLLLNSDEFTSEIGKAVLSFGRLEAEIILYFDRKKVTSKFKGKPLGHLITVGTNLQLFDDNLIQALMHTKDQRNEFVHKIFSLFNNIEKENLLPTNNLLDSDIQTFLEYAITLKENSAHLAEVISQK